MKMEEELRELYWPAAEAMAKAKLAAVRGLDRAIERCGEVEALSWYLGIVAAMVERMVPPCLMCAFLARFLSRYSEREEVALPPAHCRALKEAGKLLGQAALEGLDVHEG